MLGPTLIFDKSVLQSLNTDEAVMLDNFYTSVLTPVFFVECLADLEKEMRSKSTPEQLVVSLAEKTPDGCRANVHHLDILRSELQGHFKLPTVLGRPCVGEGHYIQLGDQKGAIFEQSQEQNALYRWMKHEFLQAERDIARWWRRSLTSIDLDAMSSSVRKELGPHLRKPKTLEDARAMTDLLIDNTDPEWLTRFGLEILGVPEASDYVINKWISNRRPPLRDYLPYFIFALSINIFFCLILPTQLLRNVKPSHHVDLAYLYYLPFCSIFTSKDNFHVQIVPLFLNGTQTFVNGNDFKEELKRLVDLFSALPASEFDKGLHHFAQYPPLDTSFLTTRLWDTYLPRWRSTGPPKILDEKMRKAMKDMLKIFDESENAPGAPPSLDQLHYVTVKSSVRLRRGKWRRYSEDMETQMLANKASA